jgi:hypothetical protein
MLAKLFYNMVHNTTHFDQKGVGIVLDPKASDYLATLPEIETSRLPSGTLFWAQGRIYQVIETGPSGFHKAREWRKTEATDVALIPGSFPSRYLPLVKRGKLLPVYRSRLELIHDDQATCFVFPTETLALDAAYLDVALIQTHGAYVRNQGHDPAFAVTDGVHVFRLYYYQQTLHGRKTDLSALQVRTLLFTPRPHTDGPAYWRLLPNWTESIPSAEITQQMRPAKNTLDETLPTIPIQPSASQN